jgi:deoxyribodipyrimidine photolyase-related protein
MALFADGGLMASKSYAASGAYIGRMSGRCRTCTCDTKIATGEAAYPSNFLCWNS